MELWQRKEEFEQLYEKQGQTGLYLSHVAIALEAEGDHVPELPCLALPCSSISTIFSRR
jgi:hypothetical protein